MKDNLFISDNIYKRFDKIIIVDTYFSWNELQVEYNLDKDVVLTLDFALKHHLENIGGSVFYIDHLINNQVMEENNYLIYDFFEKWHYNKDGEDIFTYKDISFGFSFRQEFWNDFTSYIRFYINLNFLKYMGYNKIFLYSNNKLIEEILTDLNIEFSQHTGIKNFNDSFYFPIEKWMDEKVRAKGLRGFLRSLKQRVSSVFSIVMIIFDKFRKKKKNVFIQEYHPTKKVLAEIKKSDDKKVLLENFSQNSDFASKLKERTIPIFGNIKKYDEVTQSFICKLNEEKYHKLILQDGTDISESIYKIILARITPRLPYFLRTLDSCIKYVNNNRVDLVILIANIGHTATLLDLLCRKKGVPSFMIINGLLGPKYSDEAKHATYINAYSQSIKDYYFENINNVYALGDPRMDDYANIQKNNINRVNPTVTIGVSGFNPIDLNSYVAVEFDFMYDVLHLFEILQKQKENLQINIKVRPNGYKVQYEKFVKKYFSKLNINILDTIPMVEVLKETDFYISIYSQTLFEASCLGIPVVYYKKDNEILFPPFDEKSELVIAKTIDELELAFNDFQNNHSRYNEFLKKETLEKYIGPLDGKNLYRNVSFINELLELK
ncbi:hypothetical protein [Arcobacter sp.]|uniref:hypothetical protein n=1 Tax=Arcobacter sp. TaxID=1872629 RepID=UPI003C750647